MTPQRACRHTEFLANSGMFCKTIWSDWTPACVCVHLSLSPQPWCDRAPTGYLKAKRPFIPYLYSGETHQLALHSLGLREKRNGHKLESARRRIAVQSLHIARQTDRQTVKWTGRDKVSLWWIVSTWWNIILLYMIPVIIAASARKIPMKSRNTVPQLNPVNLVELIPFSVFPSTVS